MNGGFSAESISCSDLVSSKAQDVLFHHYCTLVGIFYDFRLRNVFESRRSLRQIGYLLAVKGSLRHHTPDRSDEYRHTVNELGTHGSALIRVYCGGVGAKINLVSFEFVHRRLVLEHNKLAVVLESGLKPGRHLGQVRVTNLLAFLVDDTPTTGSANEQAALGDLREES